MGVSTDKLGRALMGQPDMMSGLHTHGAPPSNFLKWKKNNSALHFSLQPLFSRTTAAGQKEGEAPALTPDLPVLGSKQKSEVRKPHSLPLFLHLLVIILAFVLLPFLAEIPSLILISLLYPNFPVLQHWGEERGCCDRWWIQLRFHTGVTSSFSLHNSVYVYAGWN